MKTYLTVLTLIIALTSLRGQSHMWRGDVRDSKSGIPLIGVNIVDVSQRSGTSTDTKGRFDLEIKTWPVSYEVTYLGYEIQVISASTPEELPTLVELVMEANSLAEVVISAQSSPQLITGRQRSVADFEVVDGQVLYTETSGNARSTIIVLADTDGQELDRLPIKSLKHYEQLYLSCRHTAYIICEYEVHELDLSGGKITILHTHSRKDFDKTILPCKAANKYYIYYGKEIANNTIAQILKIDVETLETSLLAEVYDAQNVEQTQRAMRLIELYGRFTKDSYANAAHFKRTIKREARHLELFRRPVEYDVYTVGDTTLVFDHENGLIAYYDQTGKHTKDVDIYYNKDKKWSGITIQDHASEEVYVINREDRRIVIHRLDVSNGKLDFITYIDADIIDKIDIHQGVFWHTSSKVTGPEIGKRLFKVELGS